MEWYKRLNRIAVYLLINSLLVITLTNHLFSFNLDSTNEFINDSTSMTSKPNMLVYHPRHSIGAKTFNLLLGFSSNVIKPEISTGASFLYMFDFLKISTSDTHILGIYVGVGIGYGINSDTNGFTVMLDAGLNFLNGKILIGIGFYSIIDNLIWTYQFGISISSTLLKFDFKGGN